MLLPDAEIAERGTLAERFEEAFAAAGIPYQVRDGAFLRRPGPRSRSP